MNHTIKRPPLSAAILAALLALSSACNAASPEDDIKTNIEQFTQSKVKAEKVTPTPAKGIWQVQSEGEIFYVDASGRYGIVGGRMVDMSARKDLTEQALAVIHAVSFDSLPLDMAASKQVNGNGQRRIAIFEDPGCPVCRAFVPFADQLDNVTIYRFPLPITSQQSLQVTRNAWCSTNRAASWDAVMHGGQTQGVQEQCDISGLEPSCALPSSTALRTRPPCSWKTASAWSELRRPSSSLKNWKRPASRNNEERLNDDGQLHRAGSAWGWASGEHYVQPPFPVHALSVIRVNDDMHIAPEARQAFNHPRLADAAKLPAQHLRESGLRDTEHCGCLLLRPAACLDDFFNLHAEVAFGQHFIGIGHAQVGIHVA